MSQVQKIDFTLEGRKVLDICQHLQTRKYKTTLTMLKQLITGSKVLQVYKSSSHVVLFSDQCISLTSYYACGLGQDAGPAEGHHAGPRGGGVRPWLGRAGGQRHGGEAAADDGVSGVPQRRCGIMPGEKMRMWACV